MFIAMSLWSGQRYLASVASSILDPHQDFSHLHDFALCHAYPPALKLQYWPFHVSQSFMDDVDFGASHL